MSFPFSPDPPGKILSFHLCPHSSTSGDSIWSDTLLGRPTHNLCVRNVLIRCIWTNQWWRRLLQYLANQWQCERIYQQGASLSRWLKPLALRKLSNHKLWGMKWYKRSAINFLGKSELRFWKSKWNLLPSIGGSIMRGVVWHDCMAHPSTEHRTTPMMHNFLSTTTQLQHV